jgi:predicted Zn-dependent peptidase
MRQEFATYDDPSRLSAGAWRQAFGDNGMDPFGDLEALAKATPEALRELHRKHFYPENLAITIAGPLDIRAATEKAVAAFGMKQGGIRIVRDPAPLGKPGRIEVSGFGEGRAAMTPGYDNPLAVGSLAFALAVASEIEGSFVTYTPATDRGVVTVGQTERVSGMGIRIDSVGANDLPRLFALGRVLARRWVERYLRSPSGVGFIRGLLLVQSPAASPEAMLTAIDALTYEQFKDAASQFSKEKGVTVVGN